jgi:DHA3 family tetracycline resistance protein-like MFS transporter
MPPTRTRRRLSPFAVYLTLSFCSSFLFSTIFTVNMLYQVTVVKLTPLQLVLIGTILESSVFLFEVPTGVLADVKSRRLSVLIGYGVMGLGFLVEGSFAVFGAVALAQVLWGLGYTFTSGATEAWITDELGEDRAGEAFLRGSQAGTLGGLVAIPLSVAVGTLSIRLPILIGGGLLIGLALFLALTMTEEGFSPTPPEERTTWGLMLKTVGDARQIVRRQPVLLVLLAIGFFYGLYSEGVDRLWTPHLLDNFNAPFAVEPVIWFGVLQAVAALLSLAATEFARRRVDVNRPAALARVLMVLAGLIVAALAGFGLVRSFWIAVGLYWLIDTLRSVTSPLQTAWLNQRIDDPQVRATIFSVSGQVDAIGQIVGGPAVGAVGNASIRAALVTSAALLTPVLPLYRLAMRHGEGRGDHVESE